MGKKPPPEIDRHTLKTIGNIKAQCKGRSDDQKVENLCLSIISLGGYVKVTDLLALVIHHWLLMEGIENTIDD